jgi:hypothetical protein
MALTLAAGVGVDTGAGEGVDAADVQAAIASTTAGKRAMDRFMA